MLTKDLSLSPIALFVYNRPEHTRRTVAALLQNEEAAESDLYIFSDGARDANVDQGVKEVRDYLATIVGFKKIEIIKRAENWGLSRSITTGVTDLANRFGSVIVLEDDLVTSPYFLRYMNDALSLYQYDDRVASIHGYIYPVKKALPETFFLRGADCWGWATWKRAWDLFEPDGAKLLAELERKNLTREFDFDDSYHFTKTLERHVARERDSWAIRWYASAFLANKLTLYPGVSLIDNIGQDASGTHGNTTDAYRTKLSEREIEVRRIPLEEDGAARRMLAQYFRSLKPSIMSRIVAKIRRLA